MCTTHLIIHGKIYLFFGKELKCTRVLCATESSGKIYLNLNKMHSCSLPPKPSLLMCLCVIPIPMCLVWDLLQSYQTCAMEYDKP